MSLAPLNAPRRGWRAPALAFAAAAVSLWCAAPAPAAVFNSISEVGSPTGYAQTPYALVGADGKTAAVWRDSNAESMLLRRVAADATPAASTLTLSVPGFYQNTPEAALAKNGTVGVFWQQVQMGSFQNSLRFAGVAPDGTVQSTAPVGALNSSSPAVGLADDGSGWLSWTNDLIGNDDVYAARVAPDGTVGTPTVVNESGRDSEYPRIAVAADGAAWLAWIDADDDNLRVTYAAPGGSFGAPQTVEADDPYDGTLDLAIDSRGDGVLAYTDDPSDVDYATQLVRLPADGTPSAPVRLEEHDTSDTQPDVAVRPDGSGIVTWVNGDVDEVHARAFTADGTLSALRTVSVPGLDIQDRPRAVVSNAGRDAVMWYEDATSTGGAYEVKLREYTADGTASAIEPVSGPLPDAFPAPGELSANYSPDGTFVAAWSARAASNSATQIYVRSAVVGPANESLPTIGATPPVAGETITGTAGTWSGTGPLTYTYQWVRCSAPTDASTCQTIPGADALQYAATADDVAAGYLRLRVSAVNAADPVGAGALSAATGRVTAPVVEIPRAPTEETETNTAPTPAPAEAGIPVRLTEKAMRVGLTVSSDGVAQIPLFCPATTTGCTADGALSIALAKPTKVEAAVAAASETVLARFEGVKIAGGHSKLVAVRLAPSVIRRLQLRGVRKVRVTLRTNNRLDGRAPVRSTQRVWLRIPPLGTVFCKASRKLTVHWILRRGVQLRSVVITANGRTVARPAVDAGAATITFAANSPSITLIKIKAVTTSGQKLGSERLRLLCGGKRPAGYASIKSLVLKPMNR